MSWLQRIIDRDPKEAITDPSDPGMIKEVDPDMESPFPFEELAPLLSPTEVDGVPGPYTTGKLILIVEDEAVVANDIKDTLKSLGYEVTGIAKSGENALEKVNELRPDLVLMDIHLATAMDGIEAAGKIHMLYDIPVIYLTAFADKALIDRAKVTGPYGYIIKPYDERELQITIDIAFHKHKLDLQLKKAYGELEQRVAERTVELEQINLALSESERRYRNLFEGVPIGIYRTTMSGQILDINPALVSLLGYPNREMLMKVNVSDIYMDYRDRKRWLDLVEREGTVHDFKVQFRKYNGTIIWVRDTGKAIYDGKGQVLYYNGNIEDITERLRVDEELRSHQIELETQAEELRRAEILIKESRDKFLDLYDFAPLGYFTLNEKALITEINVTGTKLLGVERSKLVNHRLRRLIAPGDHDVWDQYFAKLWQHAEKESCTLTLKRIDGSTFPARLEGIRIPNSSNGATTVRIAISDITDIWQTENMLRETNEYLHKLIDFANAPIIIWDPDFQITRFNHAFELLTGRSEQEVIGQPLDILFPEKNRDATLALIRKTLTGERLETVEIPILASDDTIRTLLCNTANILTDDAELISTIAQGIDITERKRAERILQDVITKNPMSIQIVDKDGFTLIVNSAHTNLFGAVPPSDFSIFNDIQIKKQFGELLERIKNGEVVHFPDTYYNAHDSVSECPDVPVWVRTVVFPLYDNDGKPEKFVLMHENITENMQMEEALRTNEAKYRQLVELAQEGIWAIDADGNTSYVNPKMVMMLGYTEEEILGAHLFSFMDDAGKAIAADKMECRRQGITEEHEFEFITKGGNRIYASLATAPITDEKGVYKGALAVVSDITEQKAAGEALLVSEQRYRDVIEDQTEFICRFLPDGRLTFINEAYCNYFRLNRKEIIGKRHSVILPPDDARLMKNHLAALTPENPVAWISHRIVKPSGEVCWHRWSDRAIYDENDEVIEYQSVGRDISLIIETEIQLENYKETLEQRVRDRTSELSRTNLKLKKEIEDRKIIQKKLTLSSNEKDLLLREVHHRVKNNLQLIIGLIDMTKTRAHEPAVISTLTDIMAKVQTMGSIHTRLYESKRFDKINMKRQVHDLVEMISGFHDHDHLDITTNIDCAEIYLPVDQAIPCALALNEVISNIHKHAFSGRRNGLIDISSVKKADMIRFIISDNGVGLPSGFNIEKSNRLGLKLMRTLVEQQLHGKVQITSKAGTEVVIEFPITKGEPDYGAGTGS